VVASKVAVVAAAATVTDGGTLSVELVLDNVMGAPPAGAAWVRVTVHMLEELGPRLLGLQVSDETSGGAPELLDIANDVINACQESVVWIRVILFAVVPDGAFRI
jgi:hypothetical protein